MTNSPESLERSVMMSSVMPSLKYSCSASPLIFTKGSTAIEGVSGTVSAGWESGGAAPSGCPGYSGDGPFARPRAAVSPVAGRGGPGARITPGHRPGVGVVFFVFLPQHSYPQATGGSA